MEVKYFRGFGEVGPAVAKRNSILADLEMFRRNVTDEVQLHKLKTPNEQHYESF